jgi:hypothetical protein
MKLLRQYLKAVKMYLPREQRNDIINELSDNLLSQMEEIETGLGRPLTELEQVAVLRKHGDPMVVAGRYGATQPCVSFGRQLIGPFLYPIYIWVLWLHWGVTFAIHTYVAVFKGILGIGSFLIAIGCQFAAVTLVFAILDIYHRKSWQYRCFHLEHLQSIPRWQSTVGLILWGIYSFYWFLIPHFPALIFGGFAGLELAPVWGTFYWPILLLLLAGVAQRAINLLCPSWSWLQPTVRMAVNIIGLAMVYSIVAGYPYVIVPDPAAATQAAQNLASTFNAIIKWGFVFGFTPYWAISACFDVWFFIKHVRYRLNFRREYSDSIP